MNSILNSTQLLIAKYCIDSNDSKTLVEYRRQRLLYYCRDKERELGIKFPKKWDVHKKNDALVTLLLNEKQSGKAKINHNNNNNQKKSKNNKNDKDENNKTENKNDNENNINSEDINTTNSYLSSSTKWFDLYIHDMFIALQPLDVYSNKAYWQNLQHYLSMEWIQKSSAQSIVPLYAWPIGSRNNNRETVFVQRFRGTCEKQNTHLRLDYISSTTKEKYNEVELEYNKNEAVWKIGYLPNGKIGLQNLLLYQTEIFWMWLRENTILHTVVRVYKTNCYTERISFNSKYEQEHSYMKIINIDIETKRIICTIYNYEDEEDCKNNSLEVEQIQFSSDIEDFWNFQSMVRINEVIYFWNIDPCSLLQHQQEIDWFKKYLSSFPLALDTPLHSFKNIPGIVQIICDYI